MRKRLKNPVDCVIIEKSGTYKNLNTQNLRSKTVKIVVIGNGKVGHTIIQHICSEGHDVVVIDNDPDAIEDIVNEYDVMGICGNGASVEILESANVEKADMLIAVTCSDETNMLACVIGKKMGVRSVMARVRNYEYNSQISKMTEALDISVVINPEKEAANEILKIINFPEALRVDTFQNGSVDLVELYVPADSPLIGKTPAEIFRIYQVKVLICAVQRGEEVTIPDGNFVFETGDIVHITATKKNVKLFLHRLGLISEKIKSIFVIGGGRIAAYLCEELSKNNYKVKLVEKDYDTCVDLSEKLSAVTIIHGDGSDQSVLEEEGFQDTDAAVCLMGLDEENMIISMYAYKQGVGKIITKINKDSLVGLMESVRMASVISPKDITASRILSYIRSKNNTRGSNVITLHKLVNNRVEAIEFQAKEASKSLNIPLKELKLKKNVLIASIIRGKEVVIPNGQDTILAGDTVIVVTTTQFFNNLDDILE